MSSPPFWNGLRFAREHGLEEAKAEAARLRAAVASEHQDRLVAARASKTNRHLDAHHSPVLAPPTLAASSVHGLGHSLSTAASTLAARVRRLRTTEKLELSAIRARLQALSDSELESFALPSIPSGPLAVALGLSTPAPSTTTSAPKQSVPEDSTAAPRWSRIELALGLEIHVRDDASDEVLELARRLRALCASSAAVR